MYTVSDMEQLSIIYFFGRRGRKAYTEYRDTPLVSKGVDEAKLLGTNWKEISCIDVVFVSPLTRTLDTAYHIFKNRNIPMIAYDCLMEYPQSKDICNLRMDKSVLEKKYPNIDFQYISSNPKVYWDEEYVKERENNKLKSRIDELYATILETHGQIAIVAHSSLLGEFMFNKMGDENNELLHCHPYKFTISP